MTEQEWLTGTDPLALYTFARDATVTYQTRWQGPMTGKRFVIAERKFRLCLLACVARVAHLLPVAENRRLLEAHHEHLDGQLTDDEVTRLRETSSEHWRQEARRNKPQQHNLAYAALRSLDNTGQDRARWVFEYAGSASAERPRSSRPGSGHHVAEATIQAHLVRDILGNIFAPVLFQPSWRTAEVRHIAEVIHREGRFEDLPILADALEDARCLDANVLAHCREQGYHARGCWVVDGVLER